MRTIAQPVDGRSVDHDLQMVPAAAAAEISQYWFYPATPAT